jgi:hypothetical protein
VSWRNLLIIVASGLLATPSVGYGQGGPLDDRTDYQTITGTWENSEPGPLLAIVLWRGPWGWNQLHTSAERARCDSIFRSMRLRAEAMGQSFFGTGLAYGFLERGQRAVTIEGRRFALARGDSALVIMVNVSKGSAPSDVTTASISSEWPTGFWSKQTHPRDTTFAFRPNFGRQQTLLRAALVRSPAVATFLQ